MKTKVIKQADLTTECWLIQIWGKEHCKSCEFRGTKECGGKRIRKTGKNSKGISAPLQAVKEVV